MFFMPAKGNDMTELMLIFLCQALDAESMDMEIDLSNLGTVNTVFAALFR